MKEFLVTIQKKALYPSHATVSTHLLTTQQPLRKSPANDRIYSNVTMRERFDGILLKLQRQLCRLLRIFASLLHSTN